jgi:hypothetical protein
MPGFCTAGGGRLGRSRLASARFLASASCLRFSAAARAAFLAFSKRVSSATGRLGGCGTSAINSSAGWAVALTKLASLSAASSALPARMVAFPRGPWSSRGSRVASACPTTFIIAAISSRSRAPASCAFRLASSSATGNGIHGPGDEPGLPNPASPGALSPSSQQSGRGICSPRAPAAQRAALRASQGNRTMQARHERVRHPCLTEVL